MLAMRIVSIIHTPTKMDDRPSIAPDGRHVLCFLPRAPVTKEVGALYRQTYDMDRFAALRMLVEINLHRTGSVIPQQRRRHCARSRGRGRGSPRTTIATTTTTMSWPAAAVGSNARRASPEGSATESTVPAGPLEQQQRTQTTTAAVAFPAPAPAAGPFAPDAADAAAAAVHHAAPAHAPAAPEYRPRAPIDV